MLSVGGNDLNCWSNWSSDSQRCTGHNFFGNCQSDDYRNYPGIINHLTLSVLYYRTPADSSAECYYWPAAGSSSDGNGCPQ